MKPEVESNGEKQEDTVQLCSVRVGDGVYGVETTAIREVLGNVALQRVPLAPRYLAGALTYRGDVLEVVSLRTLLGLETHTGENRFLVLEGEAGECFGLMVDSVVGMVAAAESSLEENPATLEVRGSAIFNGVYRLETGLMVRLDTGRLRPSELAHSRVFGAQTEAR